MSEKVNVWCIVDDHLDTLRDEATQAKSWADRITFFILPALVGLLFLIFGKGVDNNGASAAIAALSIFAGLLINVLVLLYTISLRPPETADKDSERRIALEKRFLRQIFANISYSILNAVIAAVLFVVVGFLPDALAKLIGAIAIALCVNFILTLLMSLKRIHMLLRRKF